MKKNLIWILPIILFTACNIAGKKKSSQVDQAKIEPGFAVTFNGTTHTGTAVAVFNLLDKQLIQIELDGKSLVSYNGDALNGSPVPIIGGYSYDATIRSYKPEHTFIYIDDNGKQYVNKISMQPFELVSEPAWSDSSGALTFSINRSLAAGEKISVFLFGDSIESGRLDMQSEDEMKDGYFNPDTKTVTLSAGFFNQLPTSTTGDLTLSIENDKDKLDQAPPAGGKIRVTYELEAKIKLRRMEKTMPKEI